MEELTHSCPYCREWKPKTVMIITLALLIEYNVLVDRRKFPLDEEQSSLDTFVGPSLAADIVVIKHNVSSAG